MFVTATFESRTIEAHALVPATAVLHLHDRDWVFVPAPENRFRRVEVQTGNMLSGNMQEILSGITPGQQVVSKALYLEATLGDAMICRLVDFALQNRFLVLAVAVLLFAWGAVSFHRLPVEAYPDVANNYVDVIAQFAVGGNALTQVLRGEARYDLVMRYLPPYRDTSEAIKDVRLLSPSGERVSLDQLCKVQEADEGSEIYREGNERYVAIKYSVRGRALGDAVKEAIGGWRRR